MNTITIRGCKIDERFAPCRTYYAFPCRTHEEARAAQREDSQLIPLLAAGLNLSRAQIAKAVKDYAAHWHFFDGRNGLVRRRLGMRMLRLFSAYLAAHN
jgi:hypothetical protein